MAKYLPVILLNTKKKNYKEVKNYYLFWFSEDCRQAVCCLDLEPSAGELEFVSKDSGICNTWKMLFQSVRGEGTVCTVGL